MAAEHQLLAIMFTDIMGYTSIMGSDEATALKILKRNRQLHQEVIAKHQGKLLKETGDGILSSFLSVSGAINAALEISNGSKVDPPFQLRIGVHLGEVVFENSDIYGDGVNIASRIEALAPAGGILISEAVYHNIRNKKNYQTQFLGEKSLKNVDHSVKIYQLITADEIEKSVIPENSLAVLPFVNMSNDPEQEYFCEGISEEIINTVVQIPEINVSGRTSSFSFKGKNQDLRTIGSQLGVGNILEGSVRKSGNRIRVTAQLIEVSSGFHLWSNKYDRELDDIFEIQDEISMEIARQLQQTILGQKSIPRLREQTQSVEAYQLYSKGRSLYYQRGIALMEALDCFKKALEIDPQYALAASGLADTYIMLCFHGYSAPADCWDHALAAADKAIKYGPELGETHNTKTVIALLYHRDLKLSERGFKRALEINPNHVQAKVWYGLFYLVFAKLDFEQGLDMMQKTIENDPLSAYAHSCYAMALSIAGHHEMSIDIAKKAVILDPNAWLTHYTLGFSYQWSDDSNLEKAIQEHQRGLIISDRHAWQVGLLTQAYISAGKEDLAEELYQEMLTRSREDYFPMSVLAMASAAIGNATAALDFARDAFITKDPFVINMITQSRESQHLREIPGFNEILKKYNSGQGNAGEPD